MPLTRKAYQQIRFIRIRPGRSVKHLQMKMEISGNATDRGVLHDDLETDSSQLQEATVRECAPYMSPYLGWDGPLPSLDSEQHIDFLLSHLQCLPPQYVGYDASRPWLVYWSLMGLHLLGQDISEYRARCAKPSNPRRELSLC